MTKLEKFSFYAGILGVVGDVIALTTFIAGWWGVPSTTALVPPQTAGTTDATVITIRTLEMPLIVRTILFFVFIYSWTAISWVLARRSFVARRVQNQEIVLAVIVRSVAGFGILLLPICGLWMITLWQADLPSRAEAQRIHAMVQVDQDVSGCAGDFSGADCIWDKTDAGGWASVVAFLFQGLLGALLCLVFLLLAPVVYPDMAESEMQYLLDQGTHDKALEPHNVVALPSAKRTLND